MKAINLFWLLLFAKSKKKSAHPRGPPPILMGIKGGWEETLIFLHGGLVIYLT